MKVRAAIGTAVLGVLAVAGCSSGGGEVSAPKGSSSTRSSTAATASATSELCDVFGQIVEQAQAAKERSGSDVAMFTPEEWETKLRLTEQVVDAVPSDHHDAATAYLDTVKLRKSWSDGGQRPDPSGVDPDTRAKSQELLSYVRSECDLAPNDGGRTMPAQPADESTASGDADTTELCTLFGDIAQRATESGRRPGDPNLTFTEEQWDQKIATTAKLADAAPADYEEDARTYLELVKDRKELAARFDFGTIPTDARDAFIAEHTDEQQASNRFIQFMGSTCGDSRTP